MKSSLNVLEWVVGNLYPDVKVVVEVEQRVPVDLRGAFSKSFHDGHRVRSVVGSDFYSVVDKNFFLRRRDDMIDGRRVLVGNVKIPLGYLVNSDGASPPMLELTWPLSEEEYSAMAAKLPCVAQVPVARENRYLPHPVADVEVSFDVVFSLGGRRYTEVSQDLFVDKIPFSEVSGLLRKIKEGGSVEENVAAFLAGIGSGGGALCELVNSANRLVFQTMSEMGVERSALEPRVYPQIQLGSRAVRS